MTDKSSASASRETAFTPRQRLVAAQRLAAGDGPALAAALAGVAPATLRPLLADEDGGTGGEDPDFAELLAACRRVRALRPAAWRRRALGLAREAAERALVDGRPGTLNPLLRAAGLLGAPAPRAARSAAAAAPPRRSREEEQRAALDAFFAGLSEEELAEYDALGEDGDRDGDDDAGEAEGRGEGGDDGDLGEDAAEGGDAGDDPRPRAAPGLVLLPGGVGARAEGDAARPAADPARRRPAREPVPAWHRGRDPAPGGPRRPPPPRRDG